MNEKENKIEIHKELLQQELRNRYTIKWLKQFKGFEKISKEKAKLILENMIELTILLTSSVLENK